MGIILKKALENHTDIFEEFFDILVDEANRYREGIPDNCREHYTCFATSCMVRLFFSDMNLEQVRNLFKDYVAKNPKDNGTKNCSSIF